MQERKTVDNCLVAGAGLVAGGLATFEPGLVLACAVALAALARLGARLSYAPIATCLLAVAVGAVHARRAVVSFERAGVEADRQLDGPRRCSGRALVTGSPVRVRDTLRWEARLSQLECDGVRGSPALPGVATLYGGPDDLARGDLLDVIASIAPPTRFWNPSTGDPRPAEAARGVLRTGSALDVRRLGRGASVLAWIDRVRARVRERIEASFPETAAAMARAIILGESDLAADDDQSFRQSGLAHLLAVSGMHLVLVLAVFVRSIEETLSRLPPVARRIDVGRPAAVAGIAAAWLYAELAGAGGSTLRAAWMASGMLGARALGRRGDPVRSFGLSTVAMAVADPLVGFDLSFALSVGATGGLLAFAKPLGASLESACPRALAPVARAIGTTLAATLPCIAITARIAPTLPLGGILANVVAVPIGELAALPLCLVQAALAAITPHATDLERGCALAGTGALLLVRAVARIASESWAIARVPQPTPSQVAALLFGVVAAKLVAGRPRSLVIALASSVVGVLVGLEVVARASGAPRGLVRVTFLDVAQGDAAIVDLPDGEAMIVDGGGLVGSPVDVGLRVIGPELRARRRDFVRLAVLTHPHPDHYGGLATGLAQVRVGTLWDTGQGEAEGAGQGAGPSGYAALLALARRQGAPIVRPPLVCGINLVGGATIEVLAPCPSYSPDRSPNDNSFVLRLTFGDRAFLFVGDAEHEEEAELLAHHGAALRADVLKVGHHGSRTSSSPALVARVAPEIAVISSGRRNHFGHPHASTLATLTSAGVRVFRTDTVGAVTVQTDGRSLEVQTMGP